MAKSKKVKLPKRVAGVKIPKDVRRKGEALIAQVRDQAQSDAGRAAIARGVATVAGIAATAVTAAAAKKAMTPMKAEPVPGAANDPAPPLDAHKVAEAVSTVADVVLGRLFGAGKA